MKDFPSFRFLVAIAIISIFSACSDYISDTKSVTQNGKIGLPSNVNIINTENYNSKSRTVNESIIPSIHTTTAIGGGNPIYFRYTTTPGIVTNSKSKNISTAYTRGTTITTNNFYDSYSLYSYVYSATTTWAAKISSSNNTYNESYFDEQVSLDKDWATNEFWPGPKEKCAFFAYAPYHAKGLSKFTTGGWPTFHYSVPTNVTEQSDLLVTKNQIPANASAYGNIDISGGFNQPDSLTFDHACTAIRFAIGDQMAPGVIKTIKINNVYSTGNYNYQTESWSNVDSLKSFTLTQDFEIKAGEHNKILNDADNVFMMIPQIAPAQATIEVTINDGSERTIKAYLENDEWKKGYTVTYYLSTAKVGSSYVLSISPASGNIACTGGTKAVTIKSYKQTYYGSQIAVPWTASYTYDDGDQLGTTIYNGSTDVVPSFAVSGNGSNTGESTNFQVASQVARSKSWRSSHTQTLRNAADGSCDLASGKPTANCYVIQAPGTYTFPLVYGNALNADGNPNSTSYGTATFVDHNDVLIDSPYIYATNSGANVPYDACIIWQDAPHLVTPSSVQLTSDKHSIQFTVERQNICVGNCIIAVRDKNKNIMWSWHIWVTDRDIKNTIEVHNNSSIGGSVISNFMKVPLGWCDGEVRIYDPRTFHITVKQTETGGKTATANVIQLTADSTYTYGVNATFYQWGRKDPMLPGNGMGNIDKPYYDNQYTFTKLGAQSSIGNAIKTPYTMYLIQGNWCTSNSPEFWNKGNSLYTVNNISVTKTIYDPCPANFTLPCSAAFSGFSASGSTASNSASFNNGNYFYTLGWQTGPTIFFPAIGNRYWTDGNMHEVFSIGDYASAGPSDSGNYFFIFQYEGTAYTRQSDKKAFAFPIMSVSQ